MMLEITTGKVQFWLFYPVPTAFDGKLLHFIHVFRATTHPVCKISRAKYEPNQTGLCLYSKRHAFRFQIYH